MKFGDNKKEVLSNVYAKYGEQIFKKKSDSQESKIGLVPEN